MFDPEKSSSNDDHVESRDVLSGTYAGARRTEERSPQSVPSPLEGTYIGSLSTEDLYDLNDDRSEQEGA